MYPNTMQEALFAQTFGCCRKVWNLMLGDKIACYKETGKFGYVTPTRYKNDCPFLKDVDSLALANVQMHLQAAFRNCFDKSRRKQCGFPKFKSKKKAERTYTTNNVNNSIRIGKGGIRLPKVGVGLTAV
jgi:putative transposase